MHDTLIRPARFALILAGAGLVLSACTGTSGMTANRVITAQQLAANSGSNAAHNALTSTSPSNTAIDTASADSFQSFLASTAPGSAPQTPPWASDVSLSAAGQGGGN
jgi:hypothetical protein